MTLSSTGESRVNGYLYILRRSLATFLPSDVVRDAVQEIESHLRDRIAAADAVPDERSALEKILAELGPPLRVAQAYSAERTMDEAVTTGRFVPVMRAIWHAAATTAWGFFAAVALFAGYLSATALVALAVLKPIFPNNVGLWVREGAVFPHAFGGLFPAPPGEQVAGGYWIIPIALVCGLAILVITQQGARRFLSWFRARRRVAPAAG